MSAALRPSPYRPVIESLFNVVDKQSRVVPMKLNAAQADFDATQSGRDLVPKARQLGISQYKLAHKLAKCIVHDHHRSVLVSHEEDATKRLLARVRFMLAHPQQPIEGVSVEPIETKRESAAEITFAATGSSFYIGTAGSKAFGRGDTINDLHGSEVAFWPDADGLLMGLLQSVPQDGSVTLESTGNGLNAYYKRVKRALDGGSWRVHFYPWMLAPEYTARESDAEALRLLGPLREELDEVTVAANFPTLSPRQMLWRRRKIEELGGDLRAFRQEYPMTVEECFQATGNSLFDRVTWAPTPAWNVRYRSFGGEAWLDGHPREGLTYVIGVDSSAGVGGDNSVAQIGCVDTHEQVGCWWDNRTAPDDFGAKVVELGRKCGDAYVVVEQNNHGLMVLGTMRGLYPANRIHRYKDTQSTAVDGALLNMGYVTSAKSKPLAVGRARELLASGFAIHDEPTRMELSAFAEQENGRLEAPEGEHDDRVMALVMMAVGWNKASMIAGVAAQRAERTASELSTADNPMALESILGTIRAGNQRGIDGWCSAPLLVRAS